MKRRVEHAVRDGRLCWVVQRRSWWWPAWTDERGHRYNRRHDAVAAMLNGAGPPGIRPACGRADRVAPYGG